MMMMMNIARSFFFVLVVGCVAIDFEIKSTTGSAEKWIESKFGKDCGTNDECLEQVVQFASDTHGKEDFKNAAALYEVCLKWLNPIKHKYFSQVVRNNYGRVLFELGQYEDAIFILNSLIQNVKFEPSVYDWHQNLFANAWNNLGLANTRKGSCCENIALESFQKALEIDETLNKGEVYYNIGVSLKNLGHHERAFQFYNKAIEMNPKFVAAIINLAALLHEHQMYHEAIERYLLALQVDEEQSATRLMALANLGVAYCEIGQAETGVNYFEQVLEKIYENAIEYGDENYDIQLKAQIATAKRIMCDWDDFEESVKWLENNVQERQLNHGAMPYLLPFDSLLMPVSPKFRLNLAQNFAKSFQVATNVETTLRSDQNLSPRVGYISYDFNDHPTAHLVEEMFSLHKERGRIESLTLSYGKDDGSDFRKRIQESGHGFHDVFSLSHDEMAKKIKEELRIEILVDMQGFTRGGRTEVMAAKPSPIAVNYLVFAGTSGAPFIDYFIGDRITTPLAEQARYFSEKLVVLPDCYQVNSYQNHVKGMRNLHDPNKHNLLRRPFDQDTTAILESGFVFANFNKNDKLEPRSFDAWMEILHHVPKSVLWLLEPSRRGASPKALKLRLRLEAEKRGINANRILFAPRMPKAEHLFRHQFADLFLDTLIYGAHSTATDSLRGGLPVLTVLGESFPARVAASLNANVGMGYMTVNSVKDFIKVAVTIGNSPSLAKRIRADLIEGLASMEDPGMELRKKTRMPLFDLEQYTKNIETAYEAMLELRHIGQSPRHIMVIKRKERSP